MTTIHVPAGAIAARIPRPLAEVAPDLAAEHQAKLPDLLARLATPERRKPTRHAPTMSAAVRRRYTRAGGYGW